MKVKLYFTIVLFLICCRISAQNKSQSIKWWEEDKSLGDFLIEDKDAYIFSFPTNGRARLEFRKKDFSNVNGYESKNDPVYSKDSYNPDYFMSFNDQIYAVSKVEEKDSISIYAHRFNKGSMSVSSSGSELGAFPVHSQWKAWKNFSTNSEIVPFEEDIVVRTSADKRFLVVKCDEPENRSSNLKISFSVFNSEMKKQWSKDVPLDEFAWKNVACGQTMVTNDGNVFSIITSYIDGLKERTKGLINYKYYLVGVFNNGNDKIVKELSFNNKVIRNVLLNQDVSGEVLCGGFYSNEGKYDVNGTYFYKFSSLDGAEKIRGNSIFDTQLDEVVNEKMFKEGVNFALHYPEHYPKAIYTRSDGGIYLISEKRYGEAFSHWKYFMDFLVVSFNKSGAIEWQKDFYRYHTSPGNNFVISTLSTKFKDDKVVIYTNSNLDNFNRPEAKKELELFKEHREEGHLVKFTIDETGATEYKNIYTLEKDDARLQVESFIPISNGNILGFKREVLGQKFGVLKERE